MRIKEYSWEFKGVGSRGSALAPLPVKQPHPIPHEKPKLVPQQRVLCVFFRPSPNGRAAPVRVFAEACYRFTPTVAIREGEAVFLEISKCLGLYSEEALARRLTALCRRLGATASMASANDAPTALAMARYGQKNPAVLSIDALIDYASPFEADDDLAWEMSKVASILKTLGIETVADFARLPPGSLASRFGRQGVKISRRICEQNSEPWPLFRPPQVIQENAEFQDGGVPLTVFQLQPVLFVLKGLVDQVMIRLRGRCQRLSELEIQLELDVGKSNPSAKRHRTYSVSFPMAQGATRGVMDIVSDRLEGEFGARSLEYGVTGVQIRVKETVPGAGAQRGFWSQEEKEADEWRGLMARLMIRLGKDKVFRVRPVESYFPEQAWEKEEPIFSKREGVWKSTSPAWGRDLERPSRLLREPIPMQKEEDYLIGQKKVWRVLEWRGPERISEGWWLFPDQADEVRDYYQVLTEDGRKLWGYFRKEKFFLHGFFD